jgi:hypothetical protein
MVVQIEHTGGLFGNGAETPRRFPAPRHPAFSPKTALRVISKPALKPKSSAWLPAQPSPDHRQVLRPAAPRAMHDATQPAIPRFGYFRFFALIFAFSEDE